MEYRVFKYLEFEFKNFQLLVRQATLAGLVVLIRQLDSYQLVHFTAGLLNYLCA